jgi:hypothetical protein
MRLRFESEVRDLLILSMASTDNNGVMDTYCFKEEAHKILMKTYETGLKEGFRQGYDECSDDIERYQSEK